MLIRLFDHSSATNRDSADCSLLLDSAGYARHNKIYAYPSYHYRLCEKSYNQSAIMCCSCSGHHIPWHRRPNSQSSTETAATLQSYSNDLNIIYDDALCWEDFVGVEEEAVGLSAASLSGAGLVHFVAHLRMMSLSRISLSRIILPLWEWCCNPLCSVSIASPLILLPLVGLEYFYFYHFHLTLYNKLKYNQWVQFQKNNIVDSTVNSLILVFKMMSANYTWITPSNIISVELLNESYSGDTLLKPHQAV